MFDQKIFSDRLKKLRLEKGISQNALGDKLGMSGQAISDMERCRRMTTTENIYLLAEVLETTADYLLGLSDVCERSG